MTAIQAFDLIPMAPTGVVPPADGSPYAVMHGQLKVMGAVLRVYELSTGPRVIDANDLDNFFSFELDEDLNHDD